MNTGENVKRYRIILAILLFSTSLCAEEIHLKDGTKISGQITGVTAEKFQIRTSYGDIQVPKSDIVSIAFPENEPKESPAAPISYDQVLEGAKYSNRTEGIQLTLPAGWTLASEFLNKDVHGGVKSADETQFLFITPEKFAGTLQTYAVVVETQLQGKFKDFEKIAQFDTTVDGRPAVRILMHGKNQVNNTPLKFLVYIVSYPGRVVRLSFGTFEPLFDKALPDFEKIAATYKTIPISTK